MISPINIEDYRPLIMAQVIFFKPRSKDEREEFSQVGTVGALNAVKHYDPTKGKFSTYMTYCVRNAIAKHIKKFRNHYKNKVWCPNSETLLDTPIKENESLNEYLPELTEEEQKIIDYKLAGLSRKEIATELDIPLSLVTYKISELYLKIRRSNEN